MSWSTSTPDHQSNNRGEGGGDGLLLLNKKDQWGKDNKQQLSLVGRLKNIKK